LRHARQSLPALGLSVQTSGPEVRLPRRAPVRMCEMTSTQTDQEFNPVGRP
jgi:hypothetical protein